MYYLTFVSLNDALKILLFISLQVGFDMTQLAANKCYETAGLKPSDIDVIELHDCFSANELITYEALGLCPIGKTAAIKVSFMLQLFQNFTGGRKRAGKFPPSFLYFSDLIFSREKIDMTMFLLRFVLLPVFVNYVKLSAEWMMCDNILSISL